jgi:N-acetylmuramoyl-L-alanine amidase
MSARDFARALSSRLYENQERKKLVLYISNRRIKISAKSSFIMVDDQPFQMPVIAREEKGDIYLPAQGFLHILKSTTLPGINYDPTREFLDVDVVRFTITAIDVEEKSNGTIVRLKTRKPFSERNISSFINKHGWYYLTIAGGLVDTVALNGTLTRGIVHSVESDQIGETAQVALKLRSNIISHEWYQKLNPNEIVVTLRTPLGKNSTRIKNVKDRWRLNRIVLDAGHGGKDAGTTGKYGTKEKDVVLDITKRVGRLLEKNTGIKVIYTRTEDEWVPLWKRTKLANESNGKIFVSIHVNANPNRKIKGFETYLLQSGKSEDAIEVASRENAVIKLEKDRSQYKELTGENLIMATMAQSMFMKESEDLAAIIQIELDKNIDSPNRGVKQAGFYVLIGASMPNVLVELGFISNPSEERNLKKPGYRQNISESIYNAILKFKSSRERLLAEE